jgi:hypothetical protein
MSRFSTIIRATPLLLGVGLFISACAASPDYSVVASYPYGYDEYSDCCNDPMYSSFDVGYAGFRHFHHDLAFRLGHEHFVQRVGHGFAPFGGRGYAMNIGHGFAAHGGFAGHGGRGRS